MCPWYSASYFRAPTIITQGMLILWLLPNRILVGILRKQIKVYLTVSLIRFILSGVAIFAMYA